MSLKIKNNLLQSTMLVAAMATGTLALTAIPTTAFAQDYTSGGLEGVLSDANGAAVSGTTVTLTSNGRGFTRTSVTDASGMFRFNRLPIGEYTVSADGNIVDDAKVLVNSISFVDLSSAGDEVIATGQRQSSVLVTDFSANQLGLVVDVQDTFDTQPIARNLASLALLAPGTTGGDSAFGNLASISGSSVAENAYYINGMNITDFRNFLGATSVPFEFYDQVETKTGGYAAEFGRSTGGVVNAVTKSGSNDFHVGANLYSEPDWGRSETRGSIGEDTESVGSLFERDNTDGNVWASGAIIKDRLFFFGLYNFQDFESNSYTRGIGDSEGTLTRTTQDSPFFGGKLDFILTDDHQFEYTFIRDANETIEEQADVVFDGDEVVSTDFIPGEGVSSSGGDVHIAKYTGNFGENLTLSLLYGNQTNNQTTQSSADANPVIVNSGADIGLPFIAGDWINFTISEGDDTRVLYRADLDYFLDDAFGDHHFRVGFDREELTANDFTINSGGVYWRYEDALTCDSFAARDTATSANHVEGNDCVRRQDYASGGEFETIQTALYLQDAWNVTDNLTLNLGIRNETFDNRDANGDTFTKLKNQWAPRLGFSYDLPGGRSQAFGSWGRYFLPVAANTNIRLAGGENFVRTWFDFDSLNDDLTPVLSGDSFYTDVLGNGDVGETSALVNADLDPMYADEAIIGVRHQFESSNDFIDGWETSAAITYRDLASVLEDVAIDAAVLKACDRRGIQGCESVWTGFHQYVLTNPGAAMTVTSTSGDLAGLTDADGNAFTSPITFNLTAEELGYPEASRKYTALDLTAKKRFDWGLMDFSYTLSETIGNYEGSVKSDNGQDDAGLTQDFDQPGLVDGSSGLSPNHRAHKLKVRGYYKFSDDLTLGANYRLTSPRKYGCIGVHPTDVFAQAYGAASNYCDGELVERGTAFEGKWQNQFDMSLAYSPEFDFGKVSFRADIFNIMNLRTATDYQEFGENDGGIANESYGNATQFAAPRRVRFGVSYTY